MKIFFFLCLWITFAFPDEDSKHQLKLLNPHLNLDLKSSYLRWKNFQKIRFVSNVIGSIKDFQERPQALQR
jgi:hypothetical protein